MFGGCSEDVPRGRGGALVGRWVDLRIHREEGDVRKDEEKRGSERVRIAVGERMLLSSCRNGNIRIESSLVGFSILKEEAPPGQSIRMPLEVNTDWPATPLVEVKM